MPYAGRNPQMAGRSNAAPIAAAYRVLRCLIWTRPTRRTTPDKRW